MESLESIKRLLGEEGYTCVLSDGETVLTSRERGVKPLVQLIESGTDLRGFFAADKIVGKAAALLYAHMGVAEIYAEVAGEGAAEVCRRFGIKLTYGELTPKIINRRGDGICPMERTVAEIDEPREALAAIKETLKRLSR